MNASTSSGARAGAPSVEGAFFFDALRFPDVAGSFFTLFFLVAKRPASHQ